MQGWFYIFHISYHFSCTKPFSEAKATPRVTGVVLHLSSPLSTHSNTNVCAKTITCFWKDDLRLCYFKSICLGDVIKCSCSQAGYHWNHLEMSAYHLTNDYSIHHEPAAICCGWRHMLHAP